MMTMQRKHARIKSLYSLNGGMGIDAKVPETSNQCDSALGSRVWKSSSPTHFGVIVTLTMEETLLHNCATQAWPCACPKYRSAASAYSGTIPFTVSRLASPRTSNTLWGNVLSSMVNETRGSCASAFSLGAWGAVPSTNSLPFQ